MGLLDKIIKTHFQDKNSFNIQDITYILEEFVYNSEVYSFSTKKKRAGYLELVDYFFDRMLANFDTMILLTGQKGTGKSSFALMLVKAYCKIIDIKFNPKRHMAYTNAQVIERIKNLNEFEPLICDEAINFASADE